MSKGVEVVSKMTSPKLTAPEMEDMIRMTNGSSMGRESTEKKEPTKEDLSIDLSAFDDIPDKTPKEEESLTADSKKRNILIVGCGDGGCNIAATIRNKIPDNSRCVMYNTSARALMQYRSIAASIVLPEEEDGSGKDRSYSKDVFRSGQYKRLLEEVNGMISAAATPYDYILVTTTTDGGTGGGVSPIVAKFLKDNTTIPVIILGVLPSLAEDATAQFNALSWQTDVEKTGVPHIIFDNNTHAGTSKQAMHIAVNKAIAEAMTVISGTAYGDTLISAIDNRDMLMILMNAAKRIVVVTKTDKPRVSETFDDFVLDMLKNSEQPMPKDATAIGIFVKGPKAFIESVDTSLMKVRSVIGNAQMYAHIQEADDVRISLIAAGCTAYDDRMYQMRQRYEDIMASMNHESIGAGDVLAGMANPFETTIEKKVLTKDVNIDALDL